MAIERLIGTAGLAAMTDSDGIGGTSHALGWSWKTNLAGKQIVAGYVRMNTAGTFVAGTKFRIFKRATPISASTLLQSIEIGSGIVSGAADSEQAVPGVSNILLVQNDLYFTDIFHPSTQTGNYNYKSGFGNPSSGSLSGNNVFKNGGTDTQPPDDETFTNGGFGVDIAIDDAPLSHIKGAEFLSFF